MSKINGIHYKYINKYVKYIPIIGIIILIFIYSQQADVNAPTTKNTVSLIQQIENAIIEFTQSFDFSDKMKLFGTIILLITIWTGYKYWLSKIRVIRRNEILADRVVFVVMLLVFSSHINLKSTVVGLTRLPSTNRIQHNFNIQLVQTHFEEIRLCKSKSVP